MILTVDVGNTNIVFGAYEQDKLCFSTRIYTQKDLEADQYALTVNGIMQLHGVQGSAIDGIVISSVVPKVTPALRHALALLAPQAEIVNFSRETAPPMDIRIDNPAELGADILAGAVAVKQHAALPAIIIDMGTATKITALDATGAVLGVSIMPGVFISLDALTGSASLLRGISLEPPRNAIGKNTPESMKSGVVLGTAAMLDGMIDRFEAEMGAVETIVATGGAASIVVPSCSHKIQLQDTLILEGLYATWQHVKAGNQ